ncbi:MAG: hypothetical protein V1784_11455 [bacterium]
MPRQHAMRPETLCAELENALLRLGWKIRQEKGNFHGGSCRISGQRVIIFNRRLNLEEKIEIFSQALAQEETNGIYLLPEIRQLLEAYSIEGRQKRTSSDS